LTGWQVKREKNALRSNDSFGNSHTGERFFLGQSTTVGIDSRFTAGELSHG
jgi:hypothetical protein